MDQKSVWIMKLCVLYVFYCIQALFCVEFERLSKQCADSISSSLRVVSLIQCTASCVSEIDCNAFTFKEDDMVCNLHSVQTPCCIRTTGEGKGASYRRKGYLDYWMHFNEKCYFFSNLKKTSQEAKEYCQKLNSKLAGPMGDTENTFLRNTVNEKNEKFLIGVTDFRIEGEWVYVSSMLPVQITDWHNGEPNNYWNEDCVLMEPPTGKWFDSRCIRQLNFICEAPI